ncbi:ead/Ea22-like family protein [Citrobacter freundii]|uniref:ead/Ea22-like family protein n=1 Tax=Citrobacter freundii TaxID=546 RepID=UPI0023B006FF|nr:ead/Ea22-like family protein [Citrobacter freundii]
MSNIDKLMEKLKSAALKLNCEQWQTRNGFSGVEVIVKGSVAKGHGCVSYQPVASELVDTKTAKAIALFCPANILALLDEVEAKEEQRANWFQMAQKLGEYLDGAEKRIAELESREVKLRDINDFIADVKEPTLANALSQLAKGVRAADISAIRRAGIRIAAAGKGDAS